MYDTRTQGFLKYSNLAHPHLLTCWVTPSPLPTGFHLSQAFSFIRLSQGQDLKPRTQLLPVGTCALCIVHLHAVESVHHIYWRKLMDISTFCESCSYTPTNIRSNKHRKWQTSEAFSFDSWPTVLLSNDACTSVQLTTVNVTLLSQIFFRWLFNSIV